MKRILQGSISAAVLAASAMVFSAEVDVAVQPGSIGLVLAGGGARGLAHVGVIQALEELRVPIHVVSGTSMGALVGGLYAAGLTSEELGSIVENMDWTVALSDSPVRSVLPQRRKSDDYDYANQVRLDISGSRLLVPIALLEGQQTRQLLKDYLQGAEYVDDFDTLPRPFRAVATDLETGMPVVLDAGDLARAMRASMSIPGLLAPVEDQGKLLVDGGASMNVPIDPARSMGAERVIVVDIGSVPGTQGDITSIISVAHQMLLLSIRRNSLEQIEKMHPNDILVRPDMTGIGLLNFEDSKVIVERGYQATMSLAEQLAPLQLSKQAWAEHKNSIALAPLKQPSIEFIDIENNSLLADEFLLSNLHQQIGAPVDRAGLEQDIDEIYALGYWRTVDYKIVEDQRGAGILVTATVDENDRLSFKPGLNLLTEIGESTDFNIGGRFLLDQINSRGAELYGRAQVGDELALTAEIYQPLDYRSRFFLTSFLGYDDYRVTSLGPEYDFEETVGRWRLEQTHVNLLGGYNWGKDIQIRLGLFAEQGRYRVDRAAIGGLMDGDYDEGGWLTSFLYDSLDNLYFPTSGTFLFADYQKNMDEFGADNDFERGQLIGKLAYSFGETDRNTLLFTGKVKGSSGATLEPQNLYQIGGLFNLSGIPLNSLSGRQLGFVMAQYQRRLSAGGVVPFDVYVGASLEGGQLWQDSSDIAIDDFVTAGSIYLAIETPLGPLYFAYGRTTDSVDAIYLSLAWPFLNQRTRLQR